MEFISAASHVGTPVDSSILRKPSTLGVDEGKNVARLGAREYQRKRPAESAERGILGVNVTEAERGGVWNKNVSIAGWLKARQAFGEGGEIPDRRDPVMKWKRRLRSPAAKRGYSGMVTLQGLL